MDDNKAVLVRLLRRPMSLRKYSFQYGVWNLVAWFLVFLLSSRLVFSWMQQDGTIGVEYTFYLAVWMAFFAGFVGTCTSTLYPRLKLLSGRLEPGDREWKSLETRRPETLAGGFWKPALILALVLSGISAVGLGAVIGLSGGPDRLLGFSRPAYGFYTVILPSIYVAVLAVLVSRKAVKRFVPAIERCPPLVISRKRYVLLHNVLPYAGFSATAGIFSAFARFAGYYRTGTLVPVHELSVHLAMTALVIAFFVVGAARLKTRVDFLSPIVLTGPRPEKIRASWRILYAFCIPWVVYLVLRLAFWGMEVDGVEAWVAISLKVGICLTMAFAMAYWAVTSILGRLEEEGLAAHPIVRIFRFLKESGYFKETEKA